MPKVSVIVPVYNPGAEHRRLHLVAARAVAARRTSTRSSSSTTVRPTGRRRGSTRSRPSTATCGSSTSRTRAGRAGRATSASTWRRGEFVYFVDNDDWLEREALERLHATAVENGADIVIGKVVGHGKVVRAACSAQPSRRRRSSGRRCCGCSPPHKLFRRALLDEHGIRFPEGTPPPRGPPRSWSAPTSTPSGSPCWPTTPATTGCAAATTSTPRPARLDPVGYFDNVREVLDLVEAHTEPGAAARPSCYAHWYRGKMLGRVGGRAVRAARAPVLARALRRDPPLALERYGERRATSAAVQPARALEAAARGQPRVARRARRASRTSCARASRVRGDRAGEDALVLRARGVARRAARRRCGSSARATAWTGCRRAGARRGRAPSGTATSPTSCAAAASRCSLRSTDAQPSTLLPARRSACGCAGRGDAGRNRPRC